MPFQDHMEAFEYLFALQKRLKLRNFHAAAKHLHFYLSGAGAATSGEHVGLMQQGLQELMEKFGAQLSPADQTKIKEAEEAFRNVFNRKPYVS